jgi:hypothetical protein
MGCKSNTKPMPTTLNEIRRDAILDRPKACSLNLKLLRGFFSLGMLGLIVLGGCQTPALPPVDLTQPTWTILQGQAVWVAPKSKRDATGVAGELLLATQPDGSCWVQFAKPPFTLVTAQRTPQQWRIAFQQDRQRYGAPGSPPTRLIWFQLARAINGQPVDNSWKFVRDPDDTWRLTNPATGERLEGYLAP